MFTTEKTLSDYQMFLINFCQLIIILIAFISALHSGTWLPGEIMNLTFCSRAHYEVNLAVLQYRIVSFASVGQS